MRAHPGPPRTGAPPRWRWALEFLALPQIQTAPFRRPVVVPPFGRGQPVIVVPGLLSNDRSTALLRNSLRTAGFVVEGWGQGLNTGARPAQIARLEAQLCDLAARTGKPVVLIGWSLGGLFARVLAQRHPDACRLVITLGSPFSGDRRANNAWRVYEALNDHTVDEPPFPEDPGVKPPVRTIAVWSRRDGIVAPACAAGEAGQADRVIEVPFKHFEMASVRGAVAAVLGLLREELG
ncbi:alpha/beta fold hydrolase [Novosphingobium sp.]|uniref:esterase/lipase family protein n=1 Tax=Novosphingobium sp. TaxID=1874826 RepID=UPI001E098455|nr:alpha/beta fold hydrolase [Novosphingobium sp.]MBX9664313.1 alpha/beta fold hydrolase [Novosphingobium sp.]